MCSIYKAIRIGSNFVLSNGIEILHPEISKSLLPVALLHLQLCLNIHGGRQPVLIRDKMSFYRKKLFKGGKLPLPNYCVGEWKTVSHKENRRSRA